MKIFITGHSGFVGQSLIAKSTDKVFTHWNREEGFRIESETVVIHLAGKAHDLLNPDAKEEYYEVNTELTKKVFDSFLLSDAKVFITLSSVKAVADEFIGELTERHPPNPYTHYGKSKLKAEDYIFSKVIGQGRRVYVLRPCMIHGPGNKGNLSLLHRLVSMNIPWPLGAFENKRSFCGIDNLLFIIDELINRDDIPSGIYNVADDEPISTNELIKLICQSQNRIPKLWYIPKMFIHFMATIGDKLNLPLNSERLHKLTSSYVVSNAKIKEAIDKPLLLSSSEGLLRTFNSFNP